LNDATAHAEMIAITAAAEYLGSKYLDECAIYVTLEPCIMCAGALYWSRIKELYYGADDLKFGFSLNNRSALHPKTIIKKGIMANESQRLLESFFKKLR
jgi:tRNA(adenine34) deaminase